METTITINQLTERLKAIIAFTKHNPEELKARLHTVRFIVGDKAYRAAIVKAYEKD